MIGSRCSSILQEYVDRTSAGAAPKTSPPSRVRLLLEELGRRRVFRTAAVYVMAAFAGLEGGELLVAPLDLPPWTMTFLVVLALVGFPVAIGLAWAFDNRARGPAGDVRTGHHPPRVGERPARCAARRGGSRRGGKPGHGSGRGRATRGGASGA